MKKTNQSRMADNYTSMSWGRGDKLYASDLTKMSRQVDSNENELVDLTTTTIPKIVSDVASNKSTLDEFAPKVAKIDVPEGSTIVKEIDKAVADLVNGAPETLDTIKEVADAIEQNGDAIDALNDIVTKNKVAIDSVDAEQKATAEKLATLDSKAVKYQEFGENRKTIQLANYDTISGVTTKGLGVNLAMVSKWDKVDLGSSQVSMNLNSLDGQVTINDGKVVATLDDISGSETATNALIDKKIADYHKESDAKFVSAKTTGRNSTVVVSTADDEVRLSSSETNPTGSQGGVYVGSQLIQVMTNYKPSDRKEASLLMITPSRFDLKRRDAEGQMHEIELVDLITKANKVPGVEAGVEAVKNRVETLSGEVNTKTPLESFEAFKTETNGEIQTVKSNVLQLSNSVYTKSEIDGKLTGAFHYKGSVETYAELPKEDLQVGDVWNVVQPDADHHINAGDNVAWNGSGWDALCGVVDLSGYDTIEQVAQKIADAVAPKADKTSVDAELSKKATIEALNEHCGSFDQFKTKNQQALDTKADQDFVVQQLASKVNAEQHEADKKALEAEIDKRVDKETYKTDKGVIVSELNNKVSAANFEAAKKEIEAALDAKQPAGSYVNKPEFDQFVVQYGKDKGTFALTDVVDEKLAVKADKTYVNLELAKKAEKIHSHVIADTEGLVDALAAKVEKETYIADKATFAIKTEVNEALAVKADESVVNQKLATKADNEAFEQHKVAYNEAVKQLKETKVEKNVYDAHVEATAKTLAEKLDKTTHEAYTNTVTHALGEKLDQSIYQADKSTFALKTDLTPLATKAEVEEKLAGAVASVYRYKGSVATEDELPKEQNVVGDVWNVDADGANVAWDGEKWDKLGGPIDLSAYATIESVDGKVAQAKSELQPKIDANKDEIVRVEGKVDSHDAVFTKYQQTVDGKFAGKADKVHTHTIENITGLQDALDGKQAVGDYALKSEVKTVDDKFAGYTTTEALNGLLDGKAAVVHTHTVDNVTGLQAALDAKMAASEAAKFATHEHNHDQAYLAIKGKAESAKVADSVAWANVTGTETIAVKSEVEAVDAKFASYTTTAALAAEYATKQALADGLKAKAEAAHTHVAADITDLQDKLDAKLDVGGKAESAKVADSVAWTSVTGTEGVALKSDLDSKMEASEASKFAQASHVHAIENVTGLQQALNDKIAVADADGKYALKSAITGLATKEELNGKAAASHTHQEGEVEGLTAKLATFALKSEIAGFVTDEALKRDYTNTADLGQLLDSKLDTTAGDKKYATKTELNGYQPKGDYVAKTEVNSIVEAAVKAPVFVNIPLIPEPNYTEAAIANWFGCETIEQVGQVITGDKVVYLHFTSTGKDYKIPVQYCAFKADGSNDIILMTVGLDTANDEVCKYKITIALNSDSSTVDVNKTPLVSPAA